MKLLPQTLLLFAAIIIAASSYAQDIRGCGTVKDIDGNEYQTVMMGKECWLRDNLRTAHYADGREITPAPEIPNHDQQNVLRYGRLYTWNSVLGGAEPTEETDGRVQGPCPDGWHVPSDAECTQLINYVQSQTHYWCGGDSTQIGKALAATVGWDLSGLGPCTVGNPDYTTNNATGFGALPAGFHSLPGAPTAGSISGGLGYVTFYWTCTGTYNSYGYNDIYYWGLHSNYEAVMHHDFADTDGDAHSVRCIKD